MKSFGVLFLVVWMAGCAAPQSEVLHLTERYAPTIGKVEVLFEKPSRPHKVFALLEDAYGGTPEELNARLEAKGREIGADAVIISHVNDRIITDWMLVDPCFRDPRCWPHYRPVKYHYRSVRAKAIRYTSGAKEERAP